MILTGIFMVMGHLSYPKFLKELYKVLSYDMPWKASILFLILTKMLCVVGRHNHLTIVRVFHWNGSKVTRVITSCSRNSKSLSLSLSHHFTKLDFLQYTYVTSLISIFFNGHGLFYSITFFTHTPFDHINYIFEEVGGIVLKLSLIPHGNTPLEDGY